MGQPALGQGENNFRPRISGNFQHGDAGIVLGRIVADVGKSKVARDQARLALARLRGDPFIGGGSEAEVADIENLMTEAGDESGQGAGQIAIDQEKQGKEI